MGNTDVASSLQQVGPKNGHPLRDQNPVLRPGTQASALTLGRPLPPAGCGPTSVVLPCPTLLDPMDTRFWTGLLLWLLLPGTRFQELAACPGVVRA